MRIVQVLLSDRIGGAEALAATLQSAWEARPGYETTTIYLDEGPPTSRWARLASLRRRLRKIRPDIVIAHSAIPNMYSRLAKVRGVPVVCVLHSASDDFASFPRRWSERLLRKRTGAVIAVSEQQARGYMRRFGGKGARVRVIPNGLPGSWTHKVAPSPQPRTVVTLGRVVDQKRPDLWLEIAEIAAERLPELTFEWWGPIVNDGEPEAMRLLAASKAESNVVYRGVTDMPNAVLCNADVFLHTSQREAHSIALLEAAAVGLPIVHSAEVVPSSERGFNIRFAAADANAAVSALATIIREWPKAGLAAIAEAPAVLEGANRVEKLYDEVIAELTESGGGR